MLVDAYSVRLDFTTHYPFTVALCNVTSLVKGFHPSEFKNPLDDPYAFAKRHQLEGKSVLWGNSSICPCQVVANPKECPKIPFT